MVGSTLKQLVPATLRGAIAAKLEWLQWSEAIRGEVTNDHDDVLFDDPGPEAAIGLMADWLLSAQRFSATGDGGYARHFSPASGWAMSYPETTGYIIPTMLTLARRLDRADLRESAARALDWCRAIQMDSGAYQGGMIGSTPIIPVTFNTGQILLGLAAGVAELGDPPEPCRRAAQWLTDSMDADGCWRKFPTPFAGPGEKAYETHVAWGLLEAARALNEPGFGEAAIRNIRWAIGKQTANGWFKDCCLASPITPLTHTLGYVLRGIIEGYRYSGERDLLAAAERTAQALLAVTPGDGRLPGKFDSNWRPAVEWSCLTGAVQIAACWLLLFQETGRTDYLDAARRTNAFVRRTIHASGDLGWRGGVKGSYPMDGAYGRLEFLNWAAKFAIDANLLELDVQAAVGR